MREPLEPRSHRLAEFRRTRGAALVGRERLALGVDPFHGALEALETVGAKVAGSGADDGADERHESYLYGYDYGAKPRESPTAGHHPVSLTPPHVRRTG